MPKHSRHGEPGSHLFIYLFIYGFAAPCRWGRYFETGTRADTQVCPYSLNPFEIRASLKPESWPI
ncbi:MAG TPA: hypothetical protein PLM12_11260, partial [Comamonas denitrificans]|nr:hypothetical protein [Comamonas denitrificans]